MTYLKRMILAHEQIEDRTVAKNLDIRSLGKVLYERTSERFDAAFKRIHGTVFEDLPQISNIRERLPHVGRYAGTGVREDLVVIPGGPKR